MAEPRTGRLTEELGGALAEVADRLRGAPGLDKPAAALRLLAEGVHHPCVVAVVGRVKAGKSTFINALLGQDVATVGTLETTATINHVLYGRPHPDRPVRCVWRSGQPTDEPRAFLDALQGHNEATLRRADGIARLEYRLPNPYLARVTLVDTPGTGAAVAEHGDRLAAFVGLQNQLRERHDAETRRLAREADAIVYLVGPAAGLNDQAFLEEFAAAVGPDARALNAVGVLAQVDRDPDLLADRHGIAARLAARLADGLNTVVPVSAGLQRALDALLADDRAGLLRLIAALRPVPPATLDRLLADETLFLELEPPDCPLDPAARAALLGDLPWTVFATLARVAADPTRSPDDVADHLADLAGFATLRDVLERRFVKRGEFLRCYRIAQDARRILDEVRYTHLPAAQRRQRQESARRDRFLAFVRAAAHLDPAAAADLEVFLAPPAVNPGTPAADLPAALRAADRDLARLFHALEAHGADVDALQQIEDHPALFPDPDPDELRPLLGLYGLEPDRRLPPARRTLPHIETRQRHWRQVAAYDPHPARRAVADRAVARYGLILDDLAAPPTL